MGFFHNETKVEKPRSSSPSRARLKDIPIEAMAEMGCKVCPRDRDGTKQRDAKLTPAGVTDAVHAYFLFSAPSMEDGFPDPHSRDLPTETAMRAVLGKLPKKHNYDFRVGGVIQCASGTVVAGPEETACCRNRVIADIEAAQPLVVVGVGDAPLAWATGFPAYAPTFRGSLTTVKIGRHVCYYYAINHPNWAFKAKDGKKQWGKSEHETVLEHDIDRLFGILEQLPDAPPQYYDAKQCYDGVELITGQEPGDFQRLERALADMAGLPRIAFDIETSGLRPWSQKNPLVVTSAVGTFERTVAFAVDHPDGWGSDIQRRKVWELQGEFLIHSGVKEVHNLAMEMEWMAYFYGGRMLRLTGWDDTMAQAHTLDERPGTKSLDVLVRRHFGFFLKACTRVDVTRKNWWLQYPLKDILQYNAGDPKWTNKLSRVQRPLLELEPELEYQWHRKVRLASTLVLTEAKGLPVDLQFAKDIEKKLEDEVAATERKLRQSPGVVKYERKYGTFVASNPDHVLKLMEKVYERDEVRRVDRDGRVKLSTDEEALSAMPKGEVPEAALVLEHRGAEKLLSTYVRPITEGRIVSLDGRIHSKYSSMVAVTGRLAGEDPNPQNWPKRKHKEIRGVVSVETAVERAKRWLLACDYGQIEFRVVGMASGDDNLIRYCWDPKSDVHKKWAERIVKAYGPIKDWIVEEFDVDWDEKGLKTLRQEAKNKWVFPQLFGSSTMSCARNLNLPDDVASALGQEFWDEFQRAKKWQAEALKFYEKYGYAETLGGIRRRGAMSPNEIINMPIQGTAAEIVCEAMAALSERSMVEENEDIHPILNVHDDLTFDVADAHLEDTLRIVTEEMCKPRFDWVNVPLVVEASIGGRWSDLEEIGVYRSNEIFNLRNPYE